MSEGYMGAVLRGQNPREAWEGYRRIILEDPREREVAVRLAQSPGGKELLEVSREAWRARGFAEAPFDVALEDHGRAQAIR
jgi:hypothetical protein